MEKELGVNYGIDKIYVFWYNDCIHESAAACISLHRTKKGAEKAMMFHKNEKRKEYKERYKDNEDDYDYGKFDDDCAWGVDEREVFE